MCVGPISSDEWNSFSLCLICKFFHAHDIFFFCASHNIKVKLLSLPTYEWVKLTDAAYAWENSRWRRRCSRCHCASMCSMLNAYIIGSAPTPLAHCVDVRSFPPSKTHRFLPSTCSCSSKITTPTSKHSSLLLHSNRDNNRPN